MKKSQFAARAAATTLILGFVTGFVHAAEVDDSLAAASERIRQTGAQLQEDIKKARERLGVPEPLPQTAVVAPPAPSAAPASEDLPPSNLPPGFRPK